MAEKYNAPYGGWKIKRTSDGTCAVPAPRFPELGTCYRLKTGEGNTVYEKICQNCGIWSSLPDGEDLSVSHIFECALYGYGKRLKEK